MTKYVMAVAMTLISTSALADTLVCKGGMLVGIYNRVTSLTDDGSGTLSGYRANYDHGGYGFKVTKEDSGLRLELYGNKDELVATAVSAGHDAYLALPLGKGDEVYISCWDEKE